MTCQTVLLGRSLIALFPRAKLTPPGMGFRVLLEEVPCFSPGKRNAVQSDDHELVLPQVLPGAHRKSAYAFRLWPDKVQALVTYDTMRLNDQSLPWTVRNGRYMPVGLHTPRLTVVAVKVSSP